MNDWQSDQEKQNSLIPYFYRKCTPIMKMVHVLNRTQLYPYEKTREKTNRTKKKVNPAKTKLIKAREHLYAIRVHRNVANLSGMSEKKFNWSSDQFHLCQYVCLTDFFNEL